MVLWARYIYIRKSPNYLPILSDRNETPMITLNASSFFFAYRVEDFYGYPINGKGISAYVSPNQTNQNESSQNNNKFGSVTNTPSIILNITYLVGPSNYYNVGN